MTPEEFAALVGSISPDEVETYRAHGFLDPENDGLLDDLDLVRLHVVRHELDDRGHDVESLAAAIREGNVESMLGARLFEAGAPPDFEDAAARAGIEPDELRQLLDALGFSSTGLYSDGVILDMLKTSRDAGLPWEAMLGMTRVLGDSLRRIAEAQVRLVHVYIHERLTAEGASEEEVEARIFSIEQNLAPLMDPLLQRLHREYLLDALVQDAFFHVTGSEQQARELGSVEATIAFIDIASFTALAEASGDDVAARVLDRIDAIVRALLVEHEGKLVKQVGDGFMLAFRDPAAAVRFAVATQAEIGRDPELPAIRVGINSGPALYRTGDYVGGAVNVASRVVSSAMPDQILCTEPVAMAAEKAGVAVEEVGVRMLRGVDDPLPLYRVKAG
jgi:adenylate cyclase